jgi:type I restriction enzyme, S subunit
MTLEEAVGARGLIADGDWVESKDQDPNGDVRLIQLADVGDGEYLNKSARYLTSGKAVELRCTMLQPGDVLISRMADPIGRACIFPGDAKPCATVVDICIARPDPKRVDNRWLKYAINEPRFREVVLSRAVGATRPRISGKNLRGLSLRIPPLEEQQRIADMLSRAENIVRMRREAEVKAREVIPALFVDMFGDGSSGHIRRDEGRREAVQTVALRDVVTIDAPLRVPDAMSEPDDPCIGPDSIEGSSGILLSQPTVDEVRPISGKYRYRAGDVLYSKIRPALVKATIAPSDGYCSADMYPIRCGPRIRPEYLVQVLLGPEFTRYALDRATRAQMPKINRDALFAFPIQVPVIEAQVEFATRYAMGREIIDQNVVATSRAVQAFQSLLAGVFGEGR